MHLVLEVVAVLLVAVAMALSLAHALEWPGKMRLKREHYLAVQPIYYPGFTIGGGVGEGGGMLATLALLLLTPSGTTSFWLILAALAALVVMHALYWTLTHPVNKFWVKDTQLTPAAERFLHSRGGGVGKPVDSDDWKILRDRWEGSHMWRAVFAMLALALLVTAIAL